MKNLDQIEGERTEIRDKSIKHDLVPIFYDENYGENELGKWSIHPQIGGFDFQFKFVKGGAGWNTNYLVSFLIYDKDWLYSFYKRYFQQEIGHIPSVNAILIINWSYSFKCCTTTSIWRSGIVRVMAIL